MAKIGDRVIYKERQGVITYIHQKEVYISVECVEFMVSPKELTPYVGENRTTNKILRFGYALKPTTFKLHDFSYLDTCMEYPRSLINYHETTYYFGGFAVPEILEFITWFNTNYSFGEISIESENHFGVVGIGGNRYGSKVYLDVGNDFIEIVLKIELKWVNELITKFLCVLLRTFFPVEQFHILKIKGEFHSTNIFNRFVEAINHGDGLSHYFYDSVDIKYALDSLEKHDWSCLVTNMYSQTEIYHAIVSLRK